jgi:hypothetical protein
VEVNLVPAPPASRDSRILTLLNTMEASTWRLP